MPVAWQAQYERHLHQTCSRFPEMGCILEHEIFQVCSDDFA